MEKYNESTYLSAGKYMSKHPYKADKIDDKKHIVYDEIKDVAKEKISVVANNHNNTFCRVI